MKKLALIFALGLSASLMADTLEYKCTKVINGNYNGEAYTSVATLDIELKVDLSSEDVEFSGEYTELGDLYPTNIWSYFMDNNEPKFSFRNGKVQIESYETDRFFCAGGTYSSCRTWKKLLFDTKTKIGFYTHDASNNRFFGGRRTLYSIKFQCD